MWPFDMFAFQFIIMLNVLELINLQYNTIQHFCFYWEKLPQKVKTLFCTSKEYFISKNNFLPFPICSPNHNCESKQSLREKMVAASKRASEGVLIKEIDLCLSPKSRQIEKVPETKSTKK